MIRIHLRNSGVLAGQLECSELMGSSAVSESWKTADSYKPTKLLRVHCVPAQEWVFWKIQGKSETGFCPFGAFIVNLDSTPHKQFSGQPLSPSADAHSSGILGRRQRKHGCPCWDCGCPCWKILMEPLKGVAPSPHTLGLHPMRPNFQISFLL